MWLKRTKKLFLFDFGRFNIGSGCGFGGQFICDENDWYWNWSGFDYADCSIAVVFLCKTF